MSAVPTQRRRPPRIADADAARFLLTLEDDTEDAPWMVMGDLQFWSASSVAHILRNYAHEEQLPWYVASMLPIRSRLRGARRVLRLAPDVFVAFVAERPRSSFEVAAEGGFPPFVLEVVSPSSSERDRETKRKAYEALGAQEYALFTPRAEGSLPLEGYRRGATGLFERWLPDADGRLRSEVLGLYLLGCGRLLRLQTPDGHLLPTFEEAEAARRRAEEEVERLRSELERYRIEPR
jgi:Uma2 family endonuclease